jgi:FRG domain
MAKREGHEIESLAQFIDEVSTLFYEWNVHSGCIWFRGINSAGYSLSPGTVWRNISVDDENSLVEDFLQTYAALYNPRAEDVWELYALMQHFRVPTRLLDWTKSPLVAAYFALESYQNAECPTIWVIDPYSLNNCTVRKPSVFVPTEKWPSSEGVDLSNLLPFTLRNEWSASMLESPVAIEPPLTNKRIIAQQGCFTVHGSAKRPIEEYFFDGAPDRIRKFIIPNKRNQKDMLENLFLLGMREDFIYQDLDSLAKRILRERCGPL